MTRTGPPCLGVEPFVVELQRRITGARLGGSSKIRDGGRLLHHSCLLGSMVSKAWKAIRRQAGGLRRPEEIRSTTPSQIPQIWEWSSPPAVDDLQEPHRPLLVETLHLGKGDCVGGSPAARLAQQSALVADDIQAPTLAGQAGGRTLLGREIPGLTLTCNIMTRDSSGK